MLSPRQRNLLALIMLVLVVLGCRTTPFLEAPEPGRHANYVVNLNQIYTH